MKNKPLFYSKQMDHLRPLFCRRTLLSGWILCMILGTAGCAEKSVHNPSIAALNQKAQVLIQGGQVDLAIQRLDVALDLNPNEPNTRFNLALAYQTKGSYDKAIPLLESLLKQPAGLDKNKLLLVLGQVYEAKGDAQPIGQDNLPNPQARRPWYEKALAQYRQINPQTHAVEAYMQQLQQALSSSIVNIPPEEEG
jgi:tetratricopeptide (TPR) repeat protein